MTSEKLYCADCGAKIEAGAERLEYRGAVYCADCVVECAECGAKVPRERSVEADDGRCYCEPCVAAGVVRVCAYCDSIVHRDEAREVRVACDEREYWCEDCASNHAVECEQCGELFYDCGVDDEDWTLCPSCSGDLRYCCECGHYVLDENYDANAGACIECARVRSLVRGYHSRENYALKRTPHGKMREAWGGVFRGFGLE